MGKKPNAPMPVAERAKQFAPFAAVGGLEEALRKKREELCYVDRRLLTEEAREELDRLLLSLEPGTRIRVTHYVKGVYIQTGGPFVKLDPVDRSLLVGNEKICFENIAKVEKEGAT